MIKKKIIIIGAGTLGLFLCSRLLHKNKKKFELILLEKGSEKSKYVLKKKFGNCLYYKLGIKYLVNYGIGGLSKLWGGQLCELDACDLKKRYWGINYSDLKKYYSKVYKIFNLKKYLSYEKLSKSEFKVRDVNFYFTRWIPKSNFSIFFKNIFNDKRVSIYKNVKDLNICFQKKKATGVTFLGDDNKNKKILCDCVILSMGVFETIKFLLKNKKHSPWSDNKNIGNYFQDHYSIKIGQVKILDKKKFYLFFLNRFIFGSKLQIKVKYNNKKLGISGEFRANKKNYQSILKKIIFNYKKRSKIGYNSLKKLNIFSEIKYIFFFIYYFIRKRIYLNFDKGVEFLIQSEQTPMRKNKIYIDKKTEKLKILWTISNKDIILIKNSLKNIEKYLRNFNFFRTNFKKFYNFKINKIVKKTSHTDHAAGGTIISKNKFTGVVDKNLKIWNTKNVYILCSSVFPSSGFANIGLTSLALAIRLSESLKRNLKIN